MSVQTRLDTTNREFLLSGNVSIVDSATVAQDAGAAADIAAKTLMAKDPATGKWTPHASLVAVDGTEVPRGILVDAIAQADIVAGDVTNVNIITGGNAAFDESQLVMAATFTYASNITNQNKTIGDALAELGLFPESVDFVSELENV